MRSRVGSASSLMVSSVNGIGKGPAGSCHHRIEIDCYQVQQLVRWQTSEVIGVAKIAKTGRRGFLKGAGAGVGAAAAGMGIAPQAAVAQTEAVTGPVKPGSDFMLDVIKSLGIEYCAANPGSSFRGIHESMIN